MHNFLFQFCKMSNRKKCQNLFSISLCAYEKAETDMDSYFLFGTLKIENKIAERAKHHFSSHSYFLYAYMKTINNVQFLLFFLILFCKMSNFEVLILNLFFYLFCISPFCYHGNRNSPWVVGHTITKEDVHDGKK